MRLLRARPTRAPRPRRREKPSPSRSIESPQSTHHLPVAKPRRRPAVTARDLCDAPRGRTPGGRDARAAGSTREARWGSRGTFPRGRADANPSRGGDASDATGPVRATECTESVARKELDRGDLGGGDALTHLFRRIFLSLRRWLVVIRRVEVPRGLTRGSRARATFGALHGRIRCRLTLTLVLAWQNSAVSGSRILPGGTCATGSTASASPRAFRLAPATTPDPRAARSMCARGCQARGLVSRLAVFSTSQTASVGRIGEQHLFSYFFACGIDPRI